MHDATPARPRHPPDAVPARPGHPPDAVQDRPSHVPDGVPDPPGRVPDAVLERLKRRLDAVPALLGHPRAVRVLGGGLDAEGVLRREAVGALLAAHGISVRRWPRSGATIWLGGDAAALDRLPAGVPVLLWPAPGASLPLILGPGWLLAGLVPRAEATAVRQVPLPDPLHALFGLLDRAAPDGGGSGLPGRAAGLLPALRRRRLARGWIRGVAAQGEPLPPTAVPGSILAALMGRAFLIGAPQVALYWQACAPGFPPDPRSFA